MSLALAVESLSKSETDAVSRAAAADAITEACAQRDTWCDAAADMGAVRALVALASSTANTASGDGSAERVRGDAQRQLLAWVAHAQSSAAQSSPAAASAACVWIGGTQISHLNAKPPPAWCAQLVRFDRVLSDRLQREAEAALGGAAAAARVAMAQASALRALATLARNGSCRLQIVDAEGLPVLLQIINPVYCSAVPVPVAAPAPEAAPASLPVVAEGVARAHAAGALCNLCTDRIWRVCAGRMGGVQATVELLLSLVATAERGGVCGVGAAGGQGCGALADVLGASGHYVNVNANANASAGGGAPCSAGSLVNVTAHIGAWSDAVKSCDASAHHARAQVTAARTLAPPGTPESLAAQVALATRALAALLVGATCNAMRLLKLPPPEQGIRALLRLLHVGCRPAAEAMARTATEANAKVAATAAQSDQSAAPPYGTAAVLDELQQWRTARDLAVEALLTMCTYDGDDCEDDDGSDGYATDEGSAAGGGSEGRGEGGGDSAAVSMTAEQCDRTPAGIASAVVSAFVATVASTLEADATLGAVGALADILAEHAAAAQAVATCSPPGAGSMWPPVQQIDELVSATRLAHAVATYSGSSGANAAICAAWLPPLVSIANSLSTSIEVDASRQAVGNPPQANEVGRAQAMCSCWRAMQQLCNNARAGARSGSLIDVAIRAGVMKAASSAVGLRAHAAACLPPEAPVRGARPLSASQAYEVVGIAAGVVEQLCTCAHHGEVARMAVEDAGLLLPLVDVAQGRRPQPTPAISLPPRGGAAERRVQDPLEAGCLSSPASARAEAAAQAEAEEEAVHWNNAVESARAALRAISLSPTLERKIVAFFQNMA